MSILIIANFAFDGFHDITFTEGMTAVDVDCSKDEESFEEIVVEFYHGKVVVVLKDVIVTSEMECDCFHSGDRIY